jgi:pimeloyl-ACP methyl ester carboxylesterase
MHTPIIRIVVVVLAVAAAARADAAETLRFAGSTCVRPPELHCPDQGCAGATVINGGSVAEPKTGRTYFLDYPCDLERGDDVVLILSLHGAGSYGNWQRHYFPLLDYVDKYRLVVATPFSPRRVWSAEDDEYLQNIVSSLIEQIGRSNIKAFWLAGHSQGGLTSTRIICSAFFGSKVDGFLSLSGGRVGGQAGRASGFGAPAASTPATTGRGATPPAVPAAALTPPPPPGCDFSFVFETGEYEISKLPDVSERAAKYGCSSERARREVLDVKAGYVYDSSRQDPGSDAWGRLPRPGKSEVLTYRSCRDKRVVADVVRRGKGHTEGLEPRITEELIRMMLAARGGKIQRGG